MTEGINGQPQPGSGFSADAGTFFLSNINSTVAKLDDELKRVSSQIQETRTALDGKILETQHAIKVKS